MSREEEEYKRGYRDGYRDGINENKQSPVPASSYTPIPPAYTNTVVCAKCKMEFRGVFGYVCTRSDCPMNPYIS